MDHECRCCKLDRCVCTYRVRDFSLWGWNEQTLSWILRCPWIKLLTKNYYILYSLFEVFRRRPILSLMHLEVKYDNICLLRLIVPVLFLCYNITGLLILLTCFLSSPYLLSLWKSWPQVPCIEGSHRLHRGGRHSRTDHGPQGGHDGPASLRHSLLHHGGRSCPQRKCHWG